MVQQINLTLELDNDLNLIVGNVSDLSLILNINQTSGPTKQAKPKDETALNQKCSNCAQTIQFNLFYSDQLIYESCINQNVKLKPIIQSPTQPDPEPECIVLKEDAELEIKKEILSEIEECNDIALNNLANRDNSELSQCFEPQPKKARVDYPFGKNLDYPEPKKTGAAKKPFKCPKCRMGFVAKKNVKRHLLTNKCKNLEHEGLGKNKKNVEICLSYLPKNLNLPNLNSIQAPYNQVFDQPDGTKAYVTIFAKFGDIRVTNFDLNCMKCELCKAPAHYISDLIGHRKHHHFFPNKQNKCRGCGGIFKTPDEKRRHTYYCTEKDKIVVNFCEKCEFKAQNWKDYRQHLATVHKNDWYKNKETSVPSQEYLCELCSTVFRDKKHFNTHWLRHQDPKPYKCHHCERAFLNRLAVWTHLVRVHFPAEAKYICNVCDPAVLFCQAKPYMAHTRNIHLRAGAGPPKAPCPVCGKHLNKTFVKRHVQEAHGNPNQKPKFQCPEKGCGKLFLQKHYMELHSRIHLPDELKRFRCQYCNQGFHTKQNKVEHERSHTGEKPYECSTCHKAFARKATFLDHQREHNGKGYECSVCQKVYTDRGNFRHHMQQHEKQLGIRLTYTQEERRLMKMNLLSPQQALNTPKQETL